MTPHRPTAAFAAALCTAILIALAPSAASASTCNTLRGRDLVRAAPVKVVDRASGNRHRYLACTQRSGKVRALIASRRGGRLSLGDSRGAMLVVRDRASGRTDVVNVATGKRTRLTSDGANPSGPALVTDSGAAAAPFPNGSTTRLTGFDYDGTSYPLDPDITKALLRHAKRDTIRWTTGGPSSTADLAAPDVPCAQLAGRSLKRTAAIRVVQFTFRSEYLEGEIDGLTTRIRACLIAGGPTRVLGESSYATDGVQGGSGLDVLAAAGTVIVERARASDSQEDYVSDVISIHDLATDKRTRLWGSADAKGPNTALGDPGDLVLLTEAGQVGMVFTTGTSAMVQIVGFDAAHVPHVLDTALANAAAADAIDPRSLTLSATTLSWKHGEQQRSADLAGL